MLSIPKKKLLYLMEECLDISECHKRRCTVCSRRRLVTNQVSYWFSVENLTLVCVQKTTNSSPYIKPSDLLHNTQLNLFL